MEKTLFLRENTLLAESYRNGEFLKNAWQDYLFLCQNHAELASEGLKAVERLLTLADDTEEKGTLICDKADFLAEAESIESTETEYKMLFDTLPNFFFGRFRYALMLSEHGRENDAKKVLTDLLSNPIDEETHEEAITLLEDLGGDTSEFEYDF